MTVAQLMVTRHLAGTAEFALCGDQLGARQAVAPGLALAEAPQHWYDCPACREQLGGAEPMKIPAGHRQPLEHVTSPAELATATRAGDWAWDTSNYDYQRGGVNVGLAVQQGVKGMTAKASEGTSYRDPYWAVTAGKMRASGLTWWGPYHVLYPASMSSIAAQVQQLVSILDATVPGWRTDVRFVPQLDAEKFDYMTRPPSVAECNEFRARFIAARGGGDVLGYLPPWLYGGAATGYAGPLWSSSYVAGSGSLAALYPGDGGAGLRPYVTGGKAPELWQFTSSATIANQAPSDGNVTRRPAGVLVAGMNAFLEDDVAFDATGYKNMIISVPPPANGPNSGKPESGGMRMGSIIGWGVYAQASTLSALTSLDGKVTALATALANGVAGLTPQQVLDQLDKTLRDVLAQGGHAELMDRLRQLVDHDVEHPDHLAEPAPDAVADGPGESA